MSAALRPFLNYQSEVWYVKQGHNMLIQFWLTVPSFGIEGLVMFQFRFIISM